MSGEQRLTGEVVSYSDDRGFGFVRSDGTDYFVRFTDILDEGFRTLHVGQRVTFEPYPDPGSGRLQALSVRSVRN